MNTDSSTIDASTKQWLLLLAAAAVIAVFVIIHSFINAVSKPPKAPAAMSPEITSAAGVVAVTTPATGDHFQRPLPAVQQPPTAGVPASTLTPAEKQAEAQERVHQQAEYFRRIAASSKDHRACQLTPAQIDELEKNGDLVW